MLERLRTACRQVVTSDDLAMLLKAVLDLGNVLNSGTTRGGAIGFKLGALLRLTDMKSSDRKTSALKYVLAQLEAQRGVDVVAFLRRDVPALKAAAATQVHTAAVCKWLNSSLSVRHRHERMMCPAACCFASESWLGGCADEGHQRLHGGAGEGPGDHPCRGAGCRSQHQQREQLGPAGVCRQDGGLPRSQIGRFWLLEGEPPAPSPSLQPCRHSSFDMDGTGSLTAVQALDLDARADLEHMTTFLGEKFNAKDPTCLLRTMEEVAEMVAKAGRELHVSCCSA